MYAYTYSCCMVLLAFQTFCKCRLLHALPPPFLDRFEKYTVSATDFWAKMCNQQSPETQAVMALVLQKLNQFVEVVGVDTFSGFSTNSTVVTALMATVQQQLSSKSATGTVSTEDLGISLLRGAVSKLLQIAKPHKMLQHRLAGRNLPTEYVTYYSSRQQHFSFRAWLTALLAKASPELNQCMPSAADLGADASQQDCRAGRKWVVSTNTCSSIEMLPQGTYLPVLYRSSTLQVLCLLHFCWTSGKLCALIEP